MSEILPPHLQMFLVVLRPFRDSFRVRFTSRSQLPRMEVQDFPSYISPLLDVVEKQVTALGKHFNKRLNVIVGRSDATREEIQLEINRLDTIVSELLSQYLYASRQVVPPDCAEGQRLLLGTMRHFLTQVQNWLDDLVAALEDPLAACQKRGLPTTGRVELEMKLDISPDAHLNDLQIWAKQYGCVQRVKTRAAQSRPSQGLGFFGTLVALWMGVEIIEHLFGEGD